MTVIPVSSCRSCGESWHRTLFCVIKSSWCCACHGNIYRTTISDLGRHFSHEVGGSSDREHEERPAGKVGTVLPFSTCLRGIKALRQRWPRVGKLGGSSRPLGSARCPVGGRRRGFGQASAADNRMLAEDRSLCQWPYAAAHQPPCTSAKRPAGLPPTASRPPPSSAPCPSAGRSR